MKTGDRYFVFLKNLECVDGYTYSPEEERSFMPVSEIYSKKDLSCEENYSIYDSDETLYLNAASLAFFTLRDDVVNNYMKIWQQIQSSSQYQ